MSDRVIPRSNWWTLGQTTPRWRIDRLPIMVKCPGCDRAMLLDHEIGADGLISPSLDCPLCPYHQSGVTLEEWVG